MTDFYIFAHIDHFIKLKNRFIMKKSLLKLLFIVVPVFTLSVACDKDKDSDKTVSIVGTWTATNVVGIEKEDGDIVDEYDGPLSYSLEYVFNGDKTGKEVYPDDNEDYAFIWSLSGNTLTLTFIDYEDVEVYTVKELSKSKLVLFDSWSEEDEGVLYESNETLTCTRKN